MSICKDIYIGMYRHWKDRRTHTYVQPYKCISVRELLLLHYYMYIYIHTQTDVYMYIYIYVCLCNIY